MTCWEWRRDHKAKVEPLAAAGVTVCEGKKVDWTVSEKSKIRQATAAERIGGLAE